MLKTLLHITLGLAAMLFLGSPVTAQTICDCVGLGKCPTNPIDNDQAIIEFPVSVPGNPDLGSCPLESVCITISHTWVGDISISLESPNGEHYLIMADVSNNVGGCGTQQDNAEFCIVAGTANPLTNNTEYNCNASSCSLGTCCLNGDWTMPCGGVTSPLTTAMQAPNCDLNDFNIPGAPVNGVWKLVVLDVCNMDAGILQNASLNFGCSNNSGGGGCQAHGGFFNAAEQSFCEGNQLEITPNYCGFIPPISTYSYAYAVVKNDTLLAILPQVDLTGYAVGEYEIWGFSYAESSQNQLPTLVGNSLQSTIQLFGSPLSPFCGDFSDDMVKVTVTGQSSVNIGSDITLGCWQTSHQLSAITYPTANNFTYQWLLPNGTTVPNQTSISATDTGHYIFLASDTSSGCSASDTLLLTIPPPLIDSIALLPASCNQADGSASVILPSGIANANFAWSNGASAQMNTGLEQGWYSVTVSDETCVYHQNFYLDEDISCKVKISGMIINDSENADCQPDTNPIGVGGIMLHLMPADIYTYSLPDGSYEFVVDAGDYTIEYVDEDIYDLLCPSTGAIAVSLPNIGSISTDNDFYVKLVAETNLSINMWVGTARPGFKHNNHFLYCNLSTVPMNAVINLVHDALLEDVTLSNIADTYDPATNTATWTISDIPPGTCQIIHYQMELPATVPIGTPLNGSIRIDPTINDAFPQNNFEEWTQLVSGSYDPNEKTSLTGENQWGGLIEMSDTIITYQVMFQNTGTDTAFSVLIRDTLDATLDVETIRPGIASHPYSLAFEGNNVLLFHFEDIMLPDSNRNEPASHGYVTFSIHRDPTIAIGTEIKNRAAIYFDYNAPIITNEVTHTIAKYAVHNQVEAVVCKGEAFEGVVYLSDTTLVNTYSFEFYDSIVTTHLNVLPAIELSLHEPICIGSTFLFNGQYLSTAGQYQAVLTAANGCDSIVTLSLEVLPSIMTSFQVTICEGETFAFGGQNLDAAGTYQSTNQAVGGCDSISTLNLLVLESPMTLVSTAICDGESYLFNGQSLTLPGVYQATLPALNGCDSLVELTLSLIAEPTTSLSATICSNESFLFNGLVLNNSGTYQAVLTAYNGCDSTVTLNLNVLPAVQTITGLAICEGQSIEFGNQTLQDAGIYEFLHEAENGCDSLVVLTLEVNPNTVEYLSSEICQGDIYQFGDQLLTQTGDYTFTTTNTTGCTHTTHLHLEVKPEFVEHLQVELVQGDFWNGIPIYGDTTVENHHIAVNGCDSTVFIQITVLTGTDELTRATYELLVIPNPVDASATIQLKGLESNGQLRLKLFDITGRLLHLQDFQAPICFFQRKDIPSGMYLIKVETVDGQPIGLGRLIAN